MRGLSGLATACTGALAGLALALTSNAHADDFTVVMQNTRSPDESAEVLVFVAELRGYERLVIDCDDCWVFDSWHTARVGVAEWIHGTPPGPEFEFDVAEHAPTVPFGLSRYALVFVERVEDERVLMKYQQVPVYPTADGGFASCGPVFDWEDRPPPLVDVVFSPALVVDDARRRSPFGVADPEARLHPQDGQSGASRGVEAVYDPDWHARVGDGIQCVRGVPVETLVPYMVGRLPELRAALPELVGEGR